MMDDAHRGYPQEAVLPPSPLYRTFVLRCWLEGCEAPAWRFSLLEVGSTSPRRGFTRPEDLVAFLQTAMAETEADRRVDLDRLVEVFQTASGDKAYRQAFIADPRRVLAEAGLTVPEEITYRVVENTPDSIYIVLPPLWSEEDLDGDLPGARAAQSVLLCAAGPNQAGLIPLIPGCTLAS